MCVQRFGKSLAFSTALHSSKHDLLSSNEWMNEQINTKISITHTVHILLKNTRLNGEVVLGHVMKAYMGSTATPPLLNLALDGGECWGSRNCRFTPGAHWIGSWVGIRGGPGVLKKRIITKPTDLSCILFFIRMSNCIVLTSKNSTFGIWKIWGKRVRNKRRLQKMKATKND